MGKARICIVNERDEVIGFKDRGTVQSADIYRVSALWIQNSKGEILLAQRSFNKKNDPGKWGPAVAGTIDEGETYESNIIKEVQEELGLKNQQFEKSFYRRIEGKHNYFVQWFFAIVDKPVSGFVIQKEEVESMKWFSKEKLLDELEYSPDSFLRSVRTSLEFFNS